MKCAPLVAAASFKCYLYTASDFEVTNEVPAVKLTV